jgi:hypothetical protein
MDGDAVGAMLGYQPALDAPMIEVPAQDLRTLEAVRQVVGA